MKRNIILLSFVCGLATTAVAQPRSEREMQAIATDHLCGAMARSQQQQQAQLPQQILATGMVAAYALTAQSLPTSHFSPLTSPVVFVSRDAAFAPVLGWTDEPLNADAPLPDGLQWWLDAITEAMQQQKAGGTDLSILRAPQATDVQPLVTSRWAQDTPYNDKCPVADTWTKRRAQTGCVATAMAQVMNFHEYPEKGQGMGQYTLSNNKRNARIEGTYDWANMLDAYSANAAKDATTDAVATLMYDCGLASKMAYALQGSGATSPNAAAGLVNHFSYDEAALHCSFRTFANNDTWLQTIYDELEQQRPLLYMSTDATYGAHAFVIDGCRAEDGYLHVNWGWSGDANGYFDFFNLTPKTTYQQAYGMQGYDFSQDVQSQSMITGITPPGSTEYPYEAYWCMEDEETISVDGDSIVLHLPTLINYHFMPFEGLVGLAIQNVETGHSPIQPFYYSSWDGQPVPSLSGWEAMDVPYYKYVTDALEDGDYDLFLVAWHQKAINKSMPQYIRFPARNDGRENYNIWRMTKRDGHLSISKQDVPEESGIDDIRRSWPSVTKAGAMPYADHVYDLQGRRIAPSHSHFSPFTSHLKRGIYIKNGKKHIQ